MSIAFALHREGRPTGRVVTVPEPHEVTDKTPKRTAQARARQKRVVQKLDASKKWQRATEVPAPVAPAVDIDALVAARVAEELAARGSARKTPAVRKTTTAKPVPDLAS
jgi:hypothetical protein